MKRIVSLLFVLLLAVGLFAGCGGSDGKKDSDGDKQGNDGEVSVSTADVKYVTAEGESVYRIIRSDGESAATKPAAEIFKAIKGLGVNVKNSYDKEVDNDNYEILVGNTNRPESAAALQLLEQQTGAKYNDYIICTIGKKIVINAINPDVLEQAAKYFTQNYVKAEGVVGGINYAKNSEGEFEEITVNGVTIGKFKFVRAKYNTPYLAQVEMEEAADSILEKTGYKIPIVKDDQAETEYEIIVGAPKREGIDTFKNHNEYSVKISGKKVYINGGSAHATAIAVSEFSKKLTGNLTDKDSFTGNYTETIKGYDTTKEFKQVWGDEFDGSTIDTSKWRVVDIDDIFNKDGLNGRTSIRSNDPKDVYVEDGVFTIRGHFDNQYYYGGMIRTDKAMEFRYGYLEMSAKMPHGDGFWVALWTCGYDDVKGMLQRPEIDIAEMYGNSTYYTTQLHRHPREAGILAGITEGTAALDPYKYPNYKRTLENGEQFSSDWHTFGMIWDSRSMQFTCDGEIYLSYDTSTTGIDQECFNHSMYVILSMALGFANSPEGSVEPDDSPVWNTTNKYMVDWIHLYQKNDGVHTLVLK